jgi:hypothetical protein
MMIDFLIPRDGFRKGNTVDDDDGESRRAAPLS